MNPVGLLLFRRASPCKGTLAGKPTEECTSIPEKMDQICSKLLSAACDSTSMGPCRPWGQLLR